MLDVVRMKEACRICARELCGNQRRWIFHPAAKVNLQVLLSHALGHELTRDGRGEFACSKCTFMLDRMYRFDTVIARVEALSLERLHKLLLEKDRLRQCIGGLYRKNNAEDGNAAPPGTVVEVVGTEVGSEDSPVVDLSSLQDVRYSDMIQDDLTYSVYESWADKEDAGLDQHTHTHTHTHTHHHLLQCPGADSLSGQKPRRCRGCAALRVADSDYEAVCKVPRRVGRRSTSCGPSTRYSTATLGPEDPARASGASEATTVITESSPAGLDTDKTMCDRTSPSPASSVESLDTAVDMSCPPKNHKEREETGPVKDPEEAPTRRDTPWDKAPRESPLSGLEVVLSLLRGWEYRPVKPRRGSKLPVLVKVKLEQSLTLPLPVPLRDCELYPHPPVLEVVTPCPQQELQVELAEMEEQWLDDYVQCGPFRFQQRLIDEQQGQLSQYESAAGQCVGELQRAQDQVHSLQSKIRESETRNQKLQQRLGEMELELRSAREEAQRQERNLQNLADNMNSKEAQRAVDEKFRCVEEKEEETRRLQLLLREKERDLERQRCVLTNNEETITVRTRNITSSSTSITSSSTSITSSSTSITSSSTSITSSSTSTACLELEQVCDAWRNVQRQQQDSEERHSRTMRERDDIISQLQAALSARTQEAQDLRCSLLAQIQSAPSDVLEELKVRLQLKDRLFQEVLADRTHQVQEHQEQVQDLLRTISGRDQYIQDSASRLDEVMTEQTSRLQELRRQLSSGVGSRSDSGPELQAMQEELRLALRREKESQEQSRSQATRLDSLTRTLLVKEEIIRDLQRQMVEPSGLSLVERLTQEVQELRESLVQQDGPPARGPVLGRDRPNSRQPEFGELSSEDEDEADDDLNSEYTESVDEEESKLRLQSQTPPQDLLFEGQGLMEVKQLVEQKRAVERELGELKAQLEKAGFSSLSQMRKALFSLQAENRDLKHQLTEEPQPDRKQSEEQKVLEEEEEEEEEGELDVTIEGVEDEEDISELWDAWDGELSLSQTNIQTSDDQRKKSLNLLADSSQDGVSSDSHQQDAASSATSLKTVRLQQKSKELRERLMVSEATVQAQAEQLKDYRELLTETAVQQDSKQIQVDLQDLGYETCGRSENEAEREDTSSPECDDCLFPAEFDDCLFPAEFVDCLFPAEFDDCLFPAEFVDCLFPAECDDFLFPAEFDDCLFPAEFDDCLFPAEFDDCLFPAEFDDCLFPAACDDCLFPAEFDDCLFPAEFYDCLFPAEFDDLEMCTSLDCGSQWWPSSSSSSTFTKAAQSSGSVEESSLQRLVEDLRSQLSRSQAVIRSLQSRLRSLSTSSDYGPSTPRKVNWSFQASPCQSGAEDDEGWQSADGGPLASPRHPHPDKGLQELVSRVDALEDQLRKGGKKSVSEEGKSAAWPGKFDTLIQAQARELSHLRQRLREGRGVCNILTQHLGDTTKAFEELLRATDIDYYMGQSFRDQLAQSSALAQRVSAKISGPPSFGFLGFLLSEQRADELTVTPAAQSKTRCECDRTDDQMLLRLTPAASGSRRDDTASNQMKTGRRKKCCFVDELLFLSFSDGQCSVNTQAFRVRTSVHTLIPLSLSSLFASLFRHCISPSGLLLLLLLLCAMLSKSSPLYRDSLFSFSLWEWKAQERELLLLKKLTDRERRALLAQLDNSHALSDTTDQSDRISYVSDEHGSTNEDLELCSDVDRGSDTGQKETQASTSLSTGFSTPQSKPLHGFPFSHQQPDPFLPLSFHGGYQPSPFSTSSSLDASTAMKAGASLLESSALWDVAYGTRPVRLGADLSSGSSGYQSGTSHTGSDLMKEHLREIRGLRQRLEDSIQTNDRLRQQLEERLARTATEKGAPTNIYIQGLDSVGQLSSEIRLLKEENVSLQNQLKRATKEGSKEAEQLREAALLERARLKEAELEADRLQHEVSVLQQQLCESRSLVRSLQCELQVYKRVCGVPTDTHPAAQAGDGAQSDHSSATFDPRELHVQLEQQLSGQADAQPRSRRQLFNAASTLQGQAPYGSFADRHGRHAVGHIEDFKALKQQILEGSALLRKMEFSLHQPSDSGSVRELLSDTETLRQILEEADSLLQMFWRAALPNVEETKQDQSLKEQVVSLHLRLSEKEEALKDAMERLKSSNRTKDSMEHFIVSQLSRTQDVLKKAKTNLQSAESRQEDEDEDEEEVSLGGVSVSDSDVLRQDENKEEERDRVQGPIRCT
ncbi:Myomegalin Cardiomyopathy-associated protein 2 [Collichthys lucidus]|uniref:Myomegalin Cardiomyopathy-associated protein 2 n=1 Tax=Collichthys lucidus TaxID=240159 RepID=A0A4U5ULR4_COLLU|nr:Myomegalin Cardiomyopathy-associated protein 2 [Collichthys lucidus]